MTLHPHLYSPVKHTQRFCSVSRPITFARSYHRSPKAQSRSMLAETVEASESTAEHGVSRVSGQSTTRESVRESVNGAGKNNTSSIASPASRTSGTVTTMPNHAPLFSRPLKTRRWPLGGVTKDPNSSAPSYRIQESWEESYQFDGHEFNPFTDVPATSKIIQRLGTHSDDMVSNTEGATNDFWAISSLPRAAQSRVEILRAGARIRHQNANSRATLEDALGVSRNATDQRTTEGSLEQGIASISGQQLKVAQKRLVDALIRKLSSGNLSNIIRQKLVSDLQLIGQATLLQLGMPVAFAVETENKYDVIGTGLDTLVSKLPNTSYTPWVAEFVNVLDGYGMLQNMDYTNLYRLQRNLSHASSPHESASSSRFRQELPEESAAAALERVLRVRNANKIDHNEWKVQTRRFRLELAVARLTGIMPGEKDYLKFMKSCLKASQYRELELVFHHFIEFHDGQQKQPATRRQEHQQIIPLSGTEDRAPSEMMYREYIKALARQGRMEHAQEVFSSMKRKNVLPSVVIYGVMLDGYGRQMDLQKMGWTLKALQSAGFSPTLEIYTSLMANYIRANELDRANEVYCQLKHRADLALDRQCKNVVEHLTRLRNIRGGERSSLFQDTIATMQEELANAAEQGTQESGELSPPRLNLVISFNHKLKRHTDSNNTPHFVKVFKELRQLGLQPNTTTYNILLDALMDSGKVEDGLLVLEHMKTTTVGKPDAVTYSTLIRGTIEKEMVDLGWSLYDEMMRLPLAPTLHTYSALFELVGLDPRSKLGHAVVKDHYIPGHQRIRFPIKAPIEERVGLNFAGQLYNQLCNQGLKPNQHTFGGLLSLTVRHGFMQSTRHVYLEMLYKKVEPNTAIMTMLIKGFSLQRDFESGWRVWRNMVETDIPRNVITYHHLIRLCERSLNNPEGIVEILNSPSSNGLGASPKKARKPMPEKKMTKAEKRKLERERLKVYSQVMTKKPLENTSRIPLAIWTEIRDQMSLDHVHWSRVQQYRTKFVDHSIWDPIAKETGPIMSVSEPGMSDKEENVRQSRLNTVLESPGVFSTGNDGDRLEDGHGLGDLYSTTRVAKQQGDDYSKPTVMIKEVLDGGGDAFTLKRAPRSFLVLNWNEEGNMPMLKKDMYAIAAGADAIAADAGPNAADVDPNAADAECNDDEREKST
ncbi:serine/threonine kinase [Mortierella polycephala]|uniref:Serine/threonine kinase n=1 Tax=Mortierella polycephala TaxID=41804 RepID=A0A9P6Q262_9FUNG|nr:serine/threonine kinase [Mortierella polycephala]